MTPDVLTPASLLSTSEVARRCGVSRSTLLRAVRRGELAPTLRTAGGAYRFRADDSAAYLTRLANIRADAPPSAHKLAESDASRRGLAQLLAATSTPYNNVDTLITHILATLAESLGVAVTYLARVDGADLHIERVHDRGGMGLRVGDIVPLCDTYCQTALASARALAIPDALADPVFAALPATRTFGIGSYSGTPLTRADGVLYGTLCTLHPQARPIAADELTLLSLAGRLVIQAIEHAEEEARAAAALRESEARLRTVVENAPITLSAFDADGILTLSTGRALTALGQDPGTSVGHSLFERYAAYPELCAAARQALAGGVSHCVTEISGVVIDLHFTPLHVVDGRVVEVVAVGTDVTARARAEEALRQQATHDALTGLPNRYLLYDRLERALALRRSGAGPAVLFIDLDGFKRINDTLGHDAGDLLLQEVAQRLKRCVRKSDTVARLGGDEFVVLLSPVASLDQATIVAHKVLAVLEPPLLLRGQVVTVGASIGISNADPRTQDPERLLAAADAALYRAKQGGKGRYVVAATDMMYLTPPSIAQTRVS